MLSNQEFTERTWVFKAPKGGIIARGMKLLPDGKILNSVSPNEQFWEIADRTLCFLSDRKYCTFRFNQVTRRDDGTYAFVGRCTLEQKVPTFYSLLEECVPLEEIVQRFREFTATTANLASYRDTTALNHWVFSRFNWTDMDALLRGLDESFTRLDDPAAFSMEVVGTEYVGNVKHYKFRYHTGFTTDQLPEDDAIKGEVKRLSFQRRLLFETLQEHDKIFVRKGQKSETLDDIMPLYRKLRSYGDNTLLWVTVADDTHPEGMVEQVEPGLLHGYVSRFAAYHAATYVTADTWAKVCRNAYRIRF